MSTDSLPPEFERFVQDQIASGRFKTAGEVIEAGLRLLRGHNAKLARFLRDEVTPIAEAAGCGPEPGNTPGGRIRRDSEHV